MAAQIIGKVKSGKTRKEYEVKWDSFDHVVYVSWAGWSKAGKAYSAGEAMNVAEAFLYDK